MGLFEKLGARRREEPKAREHETREAPRSDELSEAEWAELFERAKREVPELRRKTVEALEEAQRLIRGQRY